MRIGIIGDGIMGISLGYFLSQQGVETEVFETLSLLGGDSGPVTLDNGTNIDYCFHPLFSGGTYLYELAQKLGLAEQFHFYRAMRGIYLDGKIVPVNNEGELLRLPAFSWFERFRLLRILLYTKFMRAWYQLEAIDAETWLTHWHGSQAVNKFWRLLLKAKFDSSVKNIPATYIWSWLSQTILQQDKHTIGYLAGGCRGLLETMTAQIEAAGGQVHFDRPVHSVILEQNQAQKIRLTGETRSYDAVAVTSQVPQFRRLLAGNRRDYDKFLKKTTYLGVICPVLVLDRPLTQYATLSIADDKIPFTSIETNFQTSEDGCLIYLPKYTSPKSAWQNKTDDEIKEIWLKHLRAMFPDFDPACIRQFIVLRNPYAEPLHRVNGNHHIPNIRTPIDNLYLVTGAQIYPTLTSGEAWIRHSEHAAGVIIEDMQAADTKTIPPPPQ